MTTTLNVELPQEILEAATLEAERRHSTVDEMVAEYLKGLAAKPYNHPESLGEPIWIPGLTREQMYAERMRMGHEPNDQLDSLEGLYAYAEMHPCHVDLKSFKREDLYERR